MKDHEDRELLEQYTEHKSEAAFAELVRRHIDFVYSIARRIAADAHLAEDITQKVFIALAQQASRLRNCEVLAGWLHRVTRNQASMLVRAEIRRRQREFEATAMNKTSTNDAESLWDRIAPSLDAALGQLKESDRDVLLLRFFEKRSAREIGERLGLSEDAAQKRIARALERLRMVFASRGFAVPSTALAGLITFQTVTAAPSTLAAPITAAALAAGNTAGMPGSIGIFKLMSSAKIKAGAAALVLTTLAGGISIFHATDKRLIGEVAALRQSAAMAEQLRIENAHLMRMQSAANELTRLRAEGGELERLRKRRADINERAGSRHATAKSVAQSGESDDSAVKMSIVRLVTLNHWFPALFQYAETNGHKLPDRLIDAASLLAPEGAGARDEAVNLGVKDEHFEVIYHGSLAEIRDRAEIIILREKEPFIDERHQIARSYLFADGHSEIRRSADGNFEAFEREHSPAQ